MITKLKKKINLNYKIIGHRGASGLCGDNNIKSILKAVEIGCKIIEIDIRLTSNDILVLNHDNNCQIDDTNFIIDKTHSNVLKTKICSLEDVISSIPNSIILYLDVKIENNISRMITSLTKMLLQHVDLQFYICSFSTEFIHKFPLELFRKRKRKLKLGLIQHEYNKKDIDLLRDKVTYFILNKDTLHKIPKMELFIMYCGCGIFLYTINDIVSLKNIRYADFIDGIITDCPEKFIQN